MSNPTPFKNTSKARDRVSYYDLNGKLWVRVKKDGWFHFYWDFSEAGYMKAYPGSIKTIHEAFIG